MSKKMSKKFIYQLTVFLAVLMCAPPMVTLSWALFRVPATQGFIRSQQYQFYSVWFIAGLYTVFASIYLFDLQGLKAISELIGKKIYPYVVLGSLFFAYISVVIGIPLMTYWLPIGEEGQLEARVVDATIEPVRGSPCGAEISVDRDQGLFNSICVSSALADVLEPGDTLILKGIRVPAVGLHVLSVTPQNAEE